MKIGVPMEPEGETRVAIVPGSMKKLQKSGFEVIVEKAQASLLIIQIQNTQMQAQLLEIEAMSWDVKLSFQSDYRMYLSYPRAKLSHALLTHLDIQKRFRLALTVKLP